MIEDMTKHKMDEHRKRQIEFWNQTAKYQETAKYQRGFLSDFKKQPLYPKGKAREEAEAWRAIKAELGRRPESFWYPDSDDGY